MTISDREPVWSSLLESVSFQFVTFIHGFFTVLRLRDRSILMMLTVNIVIVIHVVTSSDAREVRVAIMITFFS